MIMIMIRRHCLAYDNSEGRTDRPKPGFRSRLILATLKFNKLCIDDVCAGIVDALTPDVLTTRRGSLEGLHLYKGNASGNHVYLGF